MELISIGLKAPKSPLLPSRSKHVNNDPYRGFAPTERGSMPVTVREFLWRKLRQEDGNVESALVLIPMLILFLIGMQLIIATNLRNSDLALAQGDAAARAISHDFRQGDQLIEVGGHFDKIRLLVTHRSHTLPQIVPGLVALMGGTPVTDVVGVAVVEPINE